MRRCLLCSRSVDGADVVCPTCGGALVDHDPVPTWDPAPTVPPPTAPPTPGPPPGYGPPGFGPPGYGPPGYGPPGYGYVGYGYAAGANLPIDTMAVTSLVLAIAGIVANVVIPGLPLLVCPVAAVLGHVALRRIGAQQRTSGRGVALAGVIVGWIGTAIGVLGVAVIVWFIWALSQGEGV